MTRRERYLADPARRAGYNRLSAARKASVDRALRERGIRAAFSEQRGFIQKINPRRLTEKLARLVKPVPTADEVRDHAYRILPSSSRWGVPKVHPERMTDAEKRRAVEASYDDWSGWAQEPREEAINPWYYH